MKDNGRAAIIIGGHNIYDRIGRLKNDRVFFNWLYHHYNLEAVFNISGNLFKKQGAQFPIRLILVNCRKSTPKGAAPLYDAQRDAVINSFEELYNKIKDVRDRNLLRDRADAVRRHGRTTDVQSAEREKVREGDRPIAVSTKPSGRTDAEEREGIRRTGSTGIQQTERPDGPVPTTRGPELVSTTDITQPPLHESVLQGETTYIRNIEQGGSEGDVQAGYDRVPAQSVTRADLESTRPNIPYTPLSKGESLIHIFQKIWLMKHFGNYRQLSRR